MISRFAQDDPRFLGIRQSRNRGQQQALWAGLMEARDLGCDVTVTMDCDGQDDVHSLAAMLDEYAKGADVVYGVRNDRSSDTRSKRFMAETFYRLQKAMGVDAVFNHADFRLLSSDKGLPTPRVEDPEPHPGCPARASCGRLRPP